MDLNELLVYVCKQIKWVKCAYLLLILTSGKVNFLSVSVERGYRVGTVPGY